MARVLIAARLSRTDGGPSRIERDDEDLRSWAEHEGHQVVDIATDAGVSGATNPFKRQGLGPWLKDPALITSYDLIVASSVDRLGRNARALNELKNWCEDHGKAIFVKKEALHWPAEDFTSRILWGIFEQFAQYELETITERIDKGKDKARANRALIGKAPYGFEAVGERYNRTLQPVAELKDTLCELIERALRGDTLASLCRWLDAQPGCECPQLGNKVKGKTVTGWAPNSVKAFLKNTALKGAYVYTYKGQKVTHRHEGLIGAGKWEQLQQAMNRGNGHQCKNDTALLTGIIFCEKCGGPMYRRVSSTTRKDGTKNTVEYYRCGGTGNAPSTCKNGVRFDLVEALTHASFLADIDLDGTMVTGIFANLPVFELVTVEGTDHESEIAELADRIRDLDLDAPDYEAKNAELRSERHRLQGLPSESTRVEEVPTGRTVADVWESLDEAGRRRYLMACGFKVYASDGAARMEGDPSKITAALRTIAA